jgi:arylsulfatase A-like enzyme
MIIEVCKQIGMWDQTIVVFLADHGETPDRKIREG